MGSKGASGLKSAASTRRGGTQAVARGSDVKFSDVMTETTAEAARAAAKAARERKLMIEVNIQKSNAEDAIGVRFNKGCR